MKMDNLPGPFSGLKIQNNIPNDKIEDIDVNCDIQPLVRPSSKLSIVDRIDNEPKNKHNIWRDILLEEELVDNLVNELTIRETKTLPESSERESEKFYLWTQNDFNKRFSKRKTFALHKKRVGKVAKKIAEKLNEPKYDLISKIIN